MSKSFLIAAVAASLGFAAPVAAGKTGHDASRGAVQAVFAAGPQGQKTDASRWVRSVAGKGSATISSPTKLAIIACRVDRKPQRSSQQPPAIAYPDWHLPVECMRVIETVTDATALNHLWLRQITPNLSNYGTCAEVAMNYAPVWEASHRNWVIVKVGCPTRIVDADGKVIGWHMPECQGTLPGTDYPLRCRFDPSEI